MDNNKFDLERFKAGEVAIGPDGTEFTYLGTLKNGEVVAEFGSSENSAIEIFSERTYRELKMKPKEEWTLVAKPQFADDWAHIGITFPSRYAALENIACTEWASQFEAVRIVRD